MEDLTGRQFGAYRIVAPLGEGGMAAVYKAYQPAVDRYVALKVLGRHFAENPEFVARFRHEAKIVAQLQHPHILPVFDFGESGGYSYLAMPFIHGGTLSALMQGEPASSWLTQRVVSQVCAALDYAHSKGVVHRDIKPSNILIDEGSNCVVADFGIARLAESMTRLTIKGSLMGTPAYMSPEQAAGEEAERRSDQYSFGIVLYELLTGRVPFHAETPVAIAIKHITAPLPPPRHFRESLSPAVEAVVLKALARDKEDRFSSCSELAASFAAAMQATEIVSMPGVATARARQAASVGVGPGADADAGLPTTIPYAAGAFGDVVERLDPVSEAKAEPEPRAPSTLRRVMVGALPVALVVVAVTAFLRQRLSPGEPLPPPPSVEVAASTTVPPPPSPPPPVDPARDGRGRAVSPKGGASPVERSRPPVETTAVAVPEPKRQEHPPIETPPATDPSTIPTPREIAAAMDPGPAFIFSPNKATAAAVLPAGSRLEFTAVGLTPPETLQFIQCNDPCTSARQVRRWSAQDFASGPQVIAARTAARYYFWLGVVGEGKSTVVSGESSQTAGGITTIRYVSGTTVSVKAGVPQGAVVRPVAPPSPPPPPPPPPQKAVRVGGDIKQPTKLKDAKAQYPADAQTARVQGVVIIEATIGPNGKIQDTKVLRSVPMLDAAAVDAVRQWEYTPTLLNGVPVAVIMTVTVNFTLQ